MWEWSDKLKLGTSSSAFVKKELRPLPLTEVEFEADFFFDPESSSKRQERWMGMVIEREFGGVLAMEEVRLPPPTVNGLATLLADAMLRPLNAGDRQRPSTVYLRDRPQWQELLPHLRQLGIEVVLSEDLPRFDEAVIDWMHHTKEERRSSADEIRATLRKPFPERKRTWFTDAMDLMEWTDEMLKAGYPSAGKGTPAAYDPLSTVVIHLTPDEIDAILTKTDIAKTKKLRPRLEAMVSAQQDVDLSVSEWGRVISSLSVTKQETHVRKQLMTIARKIANHLSEVLGIDTPLSSNPR